MRSSFGPSGPKELGYSAISRSTAGSYPVARGAVAEWLGRGLQSLVHRFESGRRLFGRADAGLRIGLISQTTVPGGQYAGIGCVPEVVVSPESLTHGEAEQLLDEI